MTDTHLTAPTRFVEVKGDRFAYRRWGSGESGQPPLFFLQHFRGGMDHWDPLTTDGLAAGREVILYDYRGCASSTGAPRTLIEEMADDAAEVIRALSLSKVDVVGFSLGGMVAQELTRRHPDLVRKLMLLGTQPRGGNPDPDPKMFEVAPRPVPGVDDFLFLFSARPKRPNRLAATSGSVVTSARIRIRRVRRSLCRPRSRRTRPLSRRSTPKNHSPI